MKLSKLGKVENTKQNATLIPLLVSPPPFATIIPGLAYKSYFGLFLNYYMEFSATFTRLPHLVCVIDL